MIGFCFCFLNGITSLMVNLVLLIAYLSSLIQSNKIIPNAQHVIR